MGDAGGFRLRSRRETSDQEEETKRKKKTKKKKTPNKTTPPNHPKPKTNPKTLKGVQPAKTLKVNQSLDDAGETREAELLTRY